VNAFSSGVSATGAGLPSTTTNASTSVGVSSSSLSMNTCAEWTPKGNGLPTAAPGLIAISWADTQTVPANTNAIANTPAVTIFLTHASYSV
jgi:hypothetical protein